MQDKTWIDSHTEADLKLLIDSRDLAANLLSQVSIFIDLFHQYVDLVQDNAIFTKEYGEKNPDDGDVYPTQTSPDHASPPQGVDNA